MANPRHLEHHHVAKNSVGIALADHVTQPDMARMRSYRLERLQAELRQIGYDAAILFDPINIRYATGSRNMALWTMHLPARYCFVPAGGQAILFDFKSLRDQTQRLNTISEVRPSKAWHFFGNGSRIADKVRLWADDILEVAHELCGKAPRLAIDRLDPLGYQELSSRHVEIFHAQEPCEKARAIKSADELACMNHAIAVAEAGMSDMREALKPGIAENELWAILNHVNLRLGGEWCETRLLASGGRTNPWLQECSDRLVRAGDLVSFDTDMIGPFGYCADVSRTFHCGPGKPTGEQRALYSLALEQISHNIELVKPGISLGEFSERAWRIPPKYVSSRYFSVAHGVGLCDEWPRVAHREDLEAAGYDGQLEPNMTICVESYVGEETGAEGVKLEQQVLVTETGYELLSTFPFEEELLG